MSKQLWKYLRSRVQIVTNCDKIIKGRVIDFVDEMDNDEQDEITILIANPSPDEATEISLFESEIVSIKTIQVLLPALFERKHYGKGFSLYGNIR